MSCTSTPLASSRCADTLTRDPLLPRLLQRHRRPRLPARAVPRHSGARGPPRRPPPAHGPGRDDRARHGRDARARHGRRRLGRALLAPHEARARPPRLPDGVARSAPAGEPALASRQVQHRRAAVAELVPPAHRAHADDVAGAVVVPHAVGRRRRRQPGQRGRRPVVGSRGRVGARARAPDRLHPRRVPVLHDAARRAGPVDVPLGLDRGPRRPRPVPHGRRQPRRADVRVDIRRRAVAYGPVRAHRRRRARRAGCGGRRRRAARAVWQLDRQGGRRRVGRRGPRDVAHDRARLVRARRRREARRGPPAPPARAHQP